MQPIPPAPASAPSRNPGQLPGILILVCALFTLAGTCSRSWLTMGRGDFSSHLGLVGYEFCDESRCRGEMFEPDMAKGADADITVSRYLAFLGGLATVVLAALSGVFALNRAARKAPLLALYIVAGGTAFFALLYIGRVLGDLPSGADAGPGWSFFVAFLGTAGAIVIGATMLRTAARQEPAPAGFGFPGHPGAGMAPGYYPPQPMMPPMQAAPGAAPMCPRCMQQGQVTFAAQYQRHFCSRCQQYI